MSFHFIFTTTYDAYMQYAQVLMTHIKHSYTNVSLILTHKAFTNVTLFATRFMLIARNQINVEPALTNRYIICVDDGCCYMLGLSLSENGDL